MNYDVIIIGAGLSGITAGKFLQENNKKVKILDKGKQIGGRLATRRIETNNQSVQVDYGCKYVEASSFEFSEEVVELIRKNVLKKWNTEHENTFLKDLEKKMKFVGKSSMRQIAFEMSKELDVSCSTTVNKIERSSDKWEVYDINNNSYTAENLILTMPVPQILKLLSDSEIDMPKQINDDFNQVEYSRSIVGIVFLDGKSDFNNEGGLKLNNGPISFITDNNLKGINEGSTTLSIEMSDEFSRNNWNKSEDEIADLIIDSAEEFINSKVSGYQLHKWRYSSPIKVYPKKFEYILKPGPIYFAGDAFLGSNAESAYLSGLNAAKKLLQTYSKIENESVSA